jgi:hypothetical protein
LLKEVHTLHKIRNDIQHDSRVPSDDDISRQRYTIRRLFDEVCFTVFEIDKAFNEKRYNHCVLFSNFIINYHIDYIALSIKRSIKLLIGW